MAGRIGLARRVRTLVLNADYTPLSITSAVRSIGLIEKNKAHALEMSQQTLRSEFLRLAAPSVIVLSQYVKRADYIKTHKEKALTLANRTLIFKRDDHTCQYCGAPATTVDHIVPKSKGGGFTWTNLVAACSPCNVRKGNRSLDQTAMTLRKPPRIPDAHEMNRWRYEGNTPSKLTRNSFNRQTIKLDASWKKCAQTQQRFFSPALVLIFCLRYVRRYLMSEPSVE